MLDKLIHVLAAFLGALSFQPAITTDHQPPAKTFEVRESLEPAKPDLGLQQPESAPAAQATPGITQPIERKMQFARLHLPIGFGANAKGQCDVVVHFHGAHTTLVPAYDNSGLKAALVVINLGESSSVYGNGYSDKSALDRALLTTQRTLDDLMPENKRCTIGRVALSAWSAGGAALKRLLFWPQVVERVDAVLISDGLHASYSAPRSFTIEPSGMESVLNFARLALAGSKLLSITHSAVETQGYASTTRSSRFLLDQLGIEPELSTTAGPRDMTMKARADRGSFHVHGYSGGDAKAHCDHLRAIDQLLLSDLKERWVSP